MNPRPPYQPVAKRSGFTLIELMVTLSILLVMLGLINFIFRDTQRAVSLGIETGETIGAQRGIASQIRRDFVEMVGPHEGSLPDSEAGGGFLVLTQKFIGDDGGGTDANNGVRDTGEGLTIALPAVGSAANATSSNYGRETEIRMVRSDQIGFIRNRGSDQPVGPRISGEFTSRRVPDTNRVVDVSRVWYGHLLRTLDDGTPPGSVPGGSNLLGADGSNNENPLDWLLGRQAIFLDNSVPAEGVPTGIYAEGLPVTAGVPAGLSPFSTVDGHSGLGTVTNQLLNGLCDYAFFGFEYEADPVSTHLRGSLVGPDGVGAPDTPLLPALPDTPTAAEQADYENAAINNATYARARLRANPAPSDTYQTWQIAQAHAILNDGCSDFAIEFAADMYGGSASGENVARVVPVDFDPDGQIDLDPLGNVAWYGWSGLEDSLLTPSRGPRIFEPANLYHPLADFASIAGLPNFNASAAFVWRHDRYDPGVYDPAGDAWTRSTSPADPAAADPVAIDPTEVDSEFCDWPYLIRIRYRLHDPKGQIASGGRLHIDTNGNGDIDNENPSATPPPQYPVGNEFVDSRNGIWFEQIIPVNRPLPQRRNP